MLVSQVPTAPQTMEELIPSNPFAVPIPLEFVVFAIPTPIVLELLKVPIAKTTVIA